MKLVLDIETTLDHSKIWLVVTKILETGEIQCHTESSSLKPLIEAAEQIIGHNAINFDLYLLEKLWKIPNMWNKCYDTLIMSRLAFPDRPGGHSLENWGKTLKFPKSEFDAFDGGLTPEMISYCKQDVNLTEKVYQAVKKELKDFSQKSQDLEHEVAFIVGQQERNGFLLNVPYSLTFLAELRGKLEDIEQKLVSSVPSTVVQIKTKVKTIPFNPGSRQQIGDRLIKLGWKPDKFTPTGKPVVDEGTLKHFDHPVARLIETYLMLQKRVAQVSSWIDAADPQGYVHGKVITNGAITSRMTHHSPNMAQVPNMGAIYGKECRSCWVAPEGYVMVGIDASALELCMLAHYMRDADYVQAVIHGSKESKTDIHSVNQRAANLETRDQAKTFIYAFLYGAGPAKIGSIVGGGASEGQALIDSFLHKTPALAKLRKKVTKYAEKGWLPGLDGRRILVRSPYAALNTLLQGAGAIVMKEALALFYLSLNTYRLDYRFVANVHDEWQLYCKPEDAELVGRIGTDAITTAGKILDVRCPLSGSYNIGRNWAETH